MEDDILAEPIPIAGSPCWGRIDRPGLGVEVDEDKLMRFHESYKKRGEFPTYAGKVG
jgi:L-alanine-DL-glutamate epimerase-like enolase superfamily enzyme